MAKAPAVQPRQSADRPALTRKQALIQYGMILGVSVAALWALELIDWMTSHALDRNLGIRPRTVEGLIGLVGSPLMHADVAHLVSNTVPFLVLGLFVILRGVRNFALVTAFAAIAGGLVVWLVGGDNTNHIGASGVIFGYFGYLLAMGWFERSFRAIAVAVIVGILYGGIIFGVMPGTPGVSWEGHLFGCLAGAGYAYLTAGRQRIAARAAKAKPS